MSSDTHDTDDTGDTGEGQDSTPTSVQKSDAERGNLDGTTASNAPREHSLEQAKGNGSFDDADDDRAPDSDEARMASDAGESGQDGGSMA